ncbi:AraC family transcriptional regulator [Acinetobacter sp. ANC 5054]|uniref:AraC family transcriptional regulator ligand-binding domain-containing protein n=1 Tax=Acinetobacter sp. ANC 5054 TaxID=1977877 RepID=UPI000A346D43|nr:AraC family transcriptional regulator ligand-binding domain-containing protein [Acinetobacter sp. ANC 5054]OTG80834.1 AraC family transcriptional regulator [Acinetobacter sp. ANC 5054]
MPDIHIPNGYFQLWNMVLRERELDFMQLDFLEPYQAQLQHVLSLPIDSQSAYSFFKTIMQLTQNALDCPQLVFEMAKYIRAEHFGVLGYMATRSDSVAEALHNVVRFSRLVIDGEQIVPMDISHQDKQIILSWPLHDDGYLFLNELTTACMAHLAKQIFPASLKLLSIHFAHSVQMARFHYEKFFGCPVTFSEPHYSFVIHADSLDLKSELADPSLMQLLLRQAEEAIAARPQHFQPLQQMQQYIADYLKTHQQAPKIQYLADELHLSVRTLQRQLQQQETSFKTLLETERMKRCEHFLLQQMNLTDIAMALGYSDQSALARAYKAYSGQTLLERKKALKP